MNATPARFQDGADCSTRSGICGKISFHPRQGRWRDFRLGTSRSPVAGDTITAFPDASDRMIPDVGYMPGYLAWEIVEKLKAPGVKVANRDPGGLTHKDRKLTTGASPLAAHALGKLAAKTLLAEGTAS